jgi:hypothetical protein
MAPVHVIDTGNPKQDEQHHYQAACEQSEDVHMECKATAIDSDGNSPHETTRASQQTNDNIHDQNTSAAIVDLAKNTSLQHNISPPKQDVHNNHRSSTNDVTDGKSQPTVGTPENHNDVTNVGSPRLVNAHQSKYPDTSAIAANAGSPRLDNAVSEKNLANQPIPASTMGNTANSPTSANTSTNVPLAAKFTPKDHLSSHHVQSSPLKKNVVNQVDPTTHSRPVLIRRQGPSKNSLPGILHINSLKTAIASSLLMMMSFLLELLSIPVITL